ncbi:hypothetical protein DEN29_18660 [Salmonella enterica subsp. enterica serovar Javiana]|nr:hypothetical protein [Salmonella enterica subsp. enterica serovar Javiana]EBV2938552.1 hypothetical protein [Salmonella enterica subsp. enterica serovar Javiana]EEE6990735.1 hypothetical protein [Salmonella enterica subsp. enterica serovar Javiana]EKS4680083.1 hypothetical protein [Salmonella enterica]
MQRRNRTVVIYSNNYMMCEALKHLCKTPEDVKAYYICISDIQKLNEILFYSDVSCVVLDCKFREQAWFLYNLRLNYPTLPLIVMQEKFYFSDRVLATFLGFVCLREYDAALAASSYVSLVKINQHEAFSGYCLPGMMQRRTFDIFTASALRGLLNRLLNSRLAGLFSGRGSRMKIIEGLTQGLSAKDTGEYADVTYQVVYEHRQKIMKTLQIQNYTREFITSLTI